VRYFCLTSIGKVRNNNEDYFLVFQSYEKNINIFVIADGMGGHNAGEIASKLACELILGYLLLNIDNLIDSPHDTLKSGFDYTNDKLFLMQHYNDDLIGMGTTLVLVLVIGDKIVIANVGDSRVYRIDHNGIFQMTEDHSLVYQMYKEGKITKEEINTHPQKNIITRAVGVADSIEVDIVDQKISDGCFVLMCTDGLTSMVSEAYIYETFMKSEFDEIGFRLSNEAIKMGGIDNITIVYFKT